MKKILLCCVLFFITEKSYGQDAENFYLTFDTGFLVLSDIWAYGPYIDSVYSTDIGWISIDTSYHSNQWEIGKPQKTVFNNAYSYPNAIITDTLHPCLPNDTSIFIVKMPAVMPFGGEFSFEYALNIDSGDLATIEVSKDSGVNWVESPRPDLSTSTMGWTNLTIELLYSGDYPYLFRFTLITDSDTTPRDGWIMDNFYVGVGSEGVPILNKNNSTSLYPNPVKTSLTITSIDNITNVTITNLLGQVVYRHECNSQQAVINVADWQKGMYFVKINGGQVRKFLKE